MKILNKIINICAYIVVVMIVLVLIDFFIFNKLLNLGNHRCKQHSLDEYILVEYPYVGFIDKKIAKTEPYSMYYTGNKMCENADNKIKIALFGGSTLSYNDAENKNSLNIPQYIEKILNDKLNKGVVVYNYSCGGANHRQHLHMLLEFLSDINPDIVVFYGGNNETVQYNATDPRPGYPFNYFYKAECPTWKKFLMEYSAVFSYVIGNRYIDGKINDIRAKIGWKSDEYKQKIVENYIDTIEQANKIAGLYKSEVFGQTKFISIFQPINQNLGYDVDSDVINEIRNRIKNIDFAYDYYQKYDELPQDIWYDNCHVNDEANQLMANEIAELLIDKYLKEYKK
ncbi:SGNH/GDSL hydrolase family protein [bacterium]|nr:SGNH/GDSL hydrolase family protein [bacterium]